MGDCSPEVIIAFTPMYAAIRKSLTRRTIFFPSLDGPAIMEPSCGFEGGAVNPDSSERHLSEISTIWTALDKLHNGPPEGARALLDQQLQRYSTAVRRYLKAALGDPDAADEAFQEFALRFVRGDFRRASPEGGSFRRYLKRVLGN